MTAAEFSRAYGTAVSEVMSRMPEDWSAFSRHNAGWRKGTFDARRYLVSSEARYWRACRALRAGGASTVLDVGGFLAAFPLALSRLGYRVSVAERFDYYGGAMDAVAAHLHANAVAVIDADFSQGGVVLPAAARGVDAVLCMAVAEHLAHSPRALLENVRAALRPGGTLVFEVPNIAFWPKRYALAVRGASPLAPIGELYHSEPPFTGHHREYTLADARYVLAAAGFEILEEEGFNYAIDTSRLFNRLKYLPAFLFKEWAEVLLFRCRSA